MILNYENDFFSITLTSCGRKIGNVREESEIQAKKLFDENNKIMLALSGGLDSQVVLHSFMSQNLPAECAFLYLIDCNDFEYNNVKALEKKYGFKLTVVELDPFKIKDEMIAEYEETKIPPFQLMHKKFLSLLPKEHTFIQGLDGPDFVTKDKKWYIAQTANSFVNARVRALEMVPRQGRVLSWEKTPEVFLSIIADDVVPAYMQSYPNIINNGLSYANDKPIPIIDHYDLYIKPIIYGKYWKDELEYFSKYQGPEKVNWIMEKKWHQYRKNMAYIPYNDAIKVLSSIEPKSKTYNQRD